MHFTVQNLSVVLYIIESFKYKGCLGKTMLDSNIIKKIEDFVYAKPRSIQEIAQHIDKNWRTADRYIDEIQKESGTIATRVFRGGTRGALKVVFWASVEKISHSVFQEKLEEEIFRAKNKMDFSAFDIFQHVSDKNKTTIMETAIDQNSTNLKELADLLLSAEKQILVLSGNLTFVNLKNKAIDVMDILDSLVKRGISIKILCRVDVTLDIKNIEKVLALNFKYGKELIEIRHREHPLRAFIIDNKIIRIKEVKEPTGMIKELDKKVYIFYTMKDREWAEWLSKVFWKMFSSSIDSRKRLEQLKLLKINPLRRPMASI